MIDWTETQYIYTRHFGLHVGENLTSLAFVMSEIYTVKKIYICLSDNFRSHCTYDDLIISMCQDSSIALCEHLGATFLKRIFRIHNIIQILKIFENSEFKYFCLWMYKLQFWTCIPSLIFHNTFRDIGA